MEEKISIGIEIHLQLATKSKMFCACENPKFDAMPNSSVCPICLGHPGTLPILNEKAIEMALFLGLALNGQIQKKSYFERKNYFYPDLPKGYQISQRTAPLIKNAYLEIGDQKIRIREIHLEEDTAKLYHYQDKSLIDFNRAGLPLLELVTEPDIRSAKEAKEFCQELQTISRYLGISEANMEKGEMRCEVNISLQQPTANKQQTTLGTKVEIKNLNSFRTVERAIEYEIKRQTEILEKEEKVQHETRGWDENKQKTFEQRLKEEVEDYRYFPEPDLPSLEFSDEQIKTLKAHLLELPFAKRNRFIEKYNIRPGEAKILTQDKDLAAFTEKVIMEIKSWMMAHTEEEGTEEEIWQKNKKKIVKKVIDWIINRLMSLMNTYNLKIKDLKITPEKFTEFISLILENRLSAKLGQLVLEKMFKTGKGAETIISEEELEEVSDESILERAIEKVIMENKKPVEDYKKGKVEALKFLIGKTMLETHGKAKVELVKKILEEKLK